MSEPRSSGVRRLDVRVASGNPVKLAATRAAFRRLFPSEGWRIEAAPVPSGVSDQPVGDEETLRGALQRAREAARRHPGAEFVVGIEGGVAAIDGALLAFAWVVAGDGERWGRSRSASFLLPPPVADLVRQGVELGEANDRVFGVEDSKSASGAVGLLTGDVIDRTTLYEPAVVLALAPWRRPELWA